jgi:hypothetical protein
VADGWCWFVQREKYCWLVAGGWFVVREKYCWLVADKPSAQGAHCPSLCRYDLDTSAGPTEFLDSVSRSRTAFLSTFLFLHVGMMSRWSCADSWGTPRFACPPQMYPTESLRHTCSSLTQFPYAKR